MKRAVFVLFACACSGSPAKVDIAAPLPRVTVASASDEALIPRSAARVPDSSDAPWAADFEREKMFAVYDLPNAHRVLLTWRVGESHFVKRVGEGDEAENYPVNHVSRVELAVQARGETRAISFGELSGSPEPVGISWCENTGWQAANGESWTVPLLPVRFSIGITQGDDEMAIVRDGATLHVLHRQTTDGYCETKKQGALDVCGDEWKRAADVHISKGAEIWQTVEQDSGKMREPFDCGMELWGQRLIKR